MFSFLAGQISPGKSLPISYLERVKIYQLHFGDQVGEETGEGDDFLIPLSETKHADFYQAEEGSRALISSQTAFTLVLLTLALFLPFTSSPGIV